MLYNQLLIIHYGVEPSDKILLLVCELFYNLRQICFIYYSIDHILPDSRIAKKTQIHFEMAKQI
ncbi:hypothetical protein pb186bvf_013171 [Paramecium bursaria]